MNPQEQAWLASSDAMPFLLHREWVYPEREHFFITDAHADADALIASLVATGGIRRVDPNRDALQLTPRGMSAVFVMGGDYFDKGPSSLRLLRVLRQLIDLGADVILLAGNHDVRTMLGIRHAEASDPRMSHLFLRMGKKAVPFLREVYDEHVPPNTGLLSEDEAARRLMPPPSWWTEFPKVAAPLVPAKRISKELKRCREKVGELTLELASVGMTMAMTHAALACARDLFLADDGEFSWLMRRMQLAYRAGSFLFVHAGVDDTIADVLREGGTEAVNAWFRHHWVLRPFELYNGPLGNVFRTKYRAADFPFTNLGGLHLRSAKIYAIVHGHKSHVTGQQIELRHGIVNFECDASLDRNTREKRGLPGIGCAATTIGPAGIQAISNDSEAIRVLRPAA